MLKAVLVEKVEESEDQEEKKEPLIKIAESILAFLNLKTGKNYRPRNPKGMPTTHSVWVMDRLREGYSEADCKAVIASKVREWLHDEQMAKYLTPETLFRRSNFDRYYGALE